MMSLFIAVRGGSVANERSLLESLLGEDIETAAVTSDELRSEVAAMAAA